MTRDDEVNQIARAAAGDKMAMRALVSEHTPSIFRLALRMLASVQDAEDVTQEAFLRAWRMLPNWKPEAKFATWLHRIALNLCYDRLRKPREYLFAQPPEQADSAHKQPDATLQRAQIRQAMELAIMALPDRQRAALTLTALQGHSNKDAAIIMNLSVQALESLLARARRQLKEDLTPLREFL